MELMMIGVNPKNGAQVQVDAKRVLFFKAGLELREGGRLTLVQPVAPCWVLLVGGNGSVGFQVSCNRVGQGHQ